MSENLDKIKAIKKKIKHGKLKLVKKDIKSQVLKGVKETSKEREDICKKARESAHTIVADTKRDMSNEIRKNTQSLSEGYDFIEESCGTGDPTFTFYNEPQVSESITEAFGADSRYGMIGVAEGVFAPIGVMSRNNRIYDEDHYDYLLENEMLLNKISGRGMLGTIGHHDKKVDDEDLAEGKVSHIVTDLHIQEEADGTRNLVGRLEILNTPAGNLLKTYYDSGMPLYVSSRGAGRLLNVANESYKRVDKTNYYLETFDIVKDPGFLQAKPSYVKESLEETKEDIDNNIIGENNMENEKVVPAIDTKMEAEEIINKLLHPLQEQLAELTETVKLLSDKVMEEAVDEEVAEETTEVVEEAKEEVSEEVKSEEVSESVEETAEVVEEACEIKKETEENEDEIKAPVAEACEDKKEDEEEKAEEKVEEAKSEEIVEEAKEEEKAEDEEKAEEVDEACEDKKEDEEEKAEEKVEEAKSEEIVEEAEIKKETEENEDEIKAPVAEAKSEESEIVEECGCKEKEDEEDEEEKAEEVDEAVDYEAKFKESEAVMNDLVKMVSEASARSKALVEKYELAVKELNAYKLSEELSITIDEAKEKLETKSYEEIKEEAKAETVVEEVVEEAKEEVSEEVKSEEVSEEIVVESKKAVKPVFSRFAGINESKKSAKKGFSIFG